PAIKIANTRSYGADVIVYDRHREDREKVAAGIAAERNATLVRPYDDTDIIAGQGTAGLEIAQQCRANSITPDVVLVPAGGGGLIAGCATALSALMPAVRVFSVEPSGVDDTARPPARHARAAHQPGAAATSRGRRRSATRSWRARRANSRSP